MLAVVKKSNIRGYSTLQFIEMIRTQNQKYPANYYVVSVKVKWKSSVKVSSLVCINCRWFH